MPAALMLAHTALVRSSTLAELVYMRLSVLVPSVSTTMYLATPAAGVASVRGSLGVSACQAQTMPMVMLVVPYALMESTLVPSAVQSEVSGWMAAVLQFTAGYHVAGSVVGVVSRISLGSSRSFTQPVQLLLLPLSSLWS